MHGHVQSGGTSDTQRLRDGKLDQPCCGLAGPEIQQRVVDVEEDSIISVHGRPGLIRREYQATDMDGSRLAVWVPKKPNRLRPESAWWAESSLTSLALASRRDTLDWMISRFRFRPWRGSEFCLVWRRVLSILQATPLLPCLHCQFTGLFHFHFSYKFRVFSGSVIQDSY